MQMHTKSCGVTIRGGKVVIFHGKQTVVINPEDSTTLKEAEELVWLIRNEAQEVGQNKTKKQVRDLLGITQE